MSDEQQEPESMTVPPAAGPGDGPEGRPMTVPKPLGPGDAEPGKAVAPPSTVKGPLSPGESEKPVTVREMRVRPAPGPGHAR